MRAWHWIAKGTALGLLVLAGAVTYVLTWRPGLGEYEARLLAPTGGAGLTLTWFGTAGILLRDGPHAVFIDPFLTRPPGWPALLLNRSIAPDEAKIARVLAEHGLERLDAVLVTHSHYDHAMDAGVVARLTGAQFVGSESSANIARGSGLPEERIRIGSTDGHVRYGPFRVRFVRSRHAGRTGGHPTGEITRPLVPPARYGDYRQGGTYSLLIEHREGRLLHHGSAGYQPGALRPHSASVVLLGIAFAGALEPYLEEVVDAVGARRVIPLHWDDFTRPLEAPLRPLPLLRLDRLLPELERLRPQLQIHTLPLGRPVHPFEQR